MIESLVNDVKTYYFDRFETMSQSHRFHYASRLAAWSNNQQAIDLLSRLKIAYVNPPHSLNQQQFLSELMHSPQTGRRVAHDLRLPYFEKYPNLFGIGKAIFRVRHLNIVCNIDIRKDFLTLCPKTELRQLLSDLSEDHDGLRMLSSFAVNTFYLADIHFGITIESVSPEFWYEIGLSYDLDIKEHLQLLIYLYTHCIIADSNFYSRSIPPQNIPPYQKMIFRLEQIIGVHFERISLDNKLEFLVAAKIIGLSSTLEGRIYDEAMQSLSPNGNFIIEKLNQNNRSDRETFEKSEHRNVLLIMSFEPYFKG